MDGRQGVRASIRSERWSARRQIGNMERASFIRPGRQIHRATSDGGISEKLLYSEAAPGSYRHCLVLLGFLTCNPCLISNAEKLQKETYVSVYENKIEKNRPFQCCCCVFDRIDVMYFDREEFNRMDKATCCSPFGTHCRFCPTCCDSCGEGLVMYGGDGCGNQSCTSSSCGGVCVCCNWKMLYPVKKAAKLKQVIQSARRMALLRMENLKDFNTEFTPHAHDSLGSQSISSQDLQEIQRQRDELSYVSEGEESDSDDSDDEGDERDDEEDAGNRSRRQASGRDKSSGSDSDVEPYRPPSGNRSSTRSFEEMIVTAQPYSPYPVTMSRE